MPPREIAEAVADIDELDGISVLDDPFKHGDVSKWIVKVRLCPNDLEHHPDVPRETEWYLHLPDTYPAGSIGVYPADQDEDTITATFPHQKLNVAGPEDRPWRRGEICVARYGYTLSETGAVDEPTDPGERLCWYMERALQWLRQASKDKLRGPNDPFEIPAFDTSLGSGPTIAFNESHESLDTWGTAYGEWGTVELSQLSTHTTTYATKVFRDSDGNSVFRPEWGGAVDADAGDGVLGTWVLLDELPITPPWEAPETWQELEGFFDGTTTDPYDLRANIKPILDSEPVKILLIGFPIPAVVDGDPEIIYWQPIEIEEFKNPYDINGGFRDSRRGREIAERREAPDENIWWLDADNWSHEQLIRRGHLPDWFLDRNILLIGAGALGSTVAEILVRDGCRHLTIVDSDTFEIGNVARHTLPLDDVGKNKATALADRLQSISPYVDAVDLDIAFPPRGQMPEALEATDMVIDCTASRAVREALDRVRWESPVVFCSAAMGRRANRLFCFTTYSRAFPYDEYRDAFELWRLQEQVEWDDEEDAVPERVGCWHPASVIRMDRVMAWAGTVTRLLDDTVELGLRESSFTVMETSDEGVPSISQAIPPFQDVVTWNAPDSPVSVQVPSECIEAMYDRCTADHPRETGGIIAGANRDEKPALVINTTDPPRDSIQEPTRFLRGTKEVDQWLTDARETIGITYFGEWHYHPDSLPELSDLDIEAMMEIAKDEGYACPCPLLLIVGQDDSTEYVMNAYLFHRSGGYEELQPVNGSEEGKADSKDGRGK